MTENLDIKSLKFDDKNFNKHTKFGMSLLEKSLRNNGAGRSILLDKDNKIIAGNGIIEVAGQIGLDKIKVVETSGDEIVAVKRTDISLDSKKGREMALADNATANADLEWDEEALTDVFDSEELDSWGVAFSEKQYIGEDELQDIPPLPHSYTKQEDVENFEFDKAVEYDFNYQNLEEHAENCQNEELKKLLQRRLKDFADFDFAYIADFYQSGATEEERRLLEEFGLVIATEKRALELDLLDLESSVILSGGAL